MCLFLFHLKIFPTQIYWNECLQVWMWKVPTCRHALALLLRRQNLGVPLAAVGHVTHPKAEHRVGEQELRHGREARFALLQVLPQLHHIEDLKEDDMDSLSGAHHITSVSAPIW